MYIDIKCKVLLQIYHCMYASNVSKETCEIHKEYLNVKWYSLPVRYIQSIICRECLSHPPFLWKFLFQLTPTCFTMQRWSVPNVERAKQGSNTTSFIIVQSWWSRWHWLWIWSFVTDDRWFTNYLESHPVVRGWCWLVVNSTPEILIFFVTFAFDKIWIWFVFHKGKFMIVFNYLKSLDLISHILI